MHCFLYVAFHEKSFKLTPEFWFSSLNLLNWDQKNETPLRHVSYKTAEDKLLKRLYYIILNSEEEKFASSRKTFWHFNFLSVCLAWEQLDANLNVTCLLLTLTSQYHVIITYFRTEFSWGDLGDLRQNTGEIIFVNISILRCICPRQSPCHMCRENYSRKVVISHIHYFRRSIISFIPWAVRVKRIK